jgi:peptidoglycan/LPS O-acetylase OafA/YrhL
MSPKPVAAVALIVLGIVIGTILFVGYYGDTSFGDSDVFYIVLGGAALCIAAGCVLGFTHLLDHMAGGALNELGAALADEVEDLGAGKLTVPWLMFFTTLAVCIVFGLMVLRFHKLESMWGPLPVAVAAMVAMIMTALIVALSKWFKNPSFHIPFAVYLIPVAGIILATYLGVSNTEDVGQLDFRYQNSGYHYVYAGRPMYIFGSGSSSSGSTSTPQCKGKGCGMAFLVVALVVLTIVLVVGSATIPHFWLVSGGIFLTLMCMLTVRELIINPRRRDANVTDETKAGSLIESANTPQPAPPAVRATRRHQRGHH